MFLRFALPNTTSFIFLHWSMLILDLLRIAEIFALCFELNVQQIALVVFVRSKVSDSVRADLS